MKEYTPWAKHTHSNEQIFGDVLTDYVNRADVRKAMNIPTDLPGWTVCTNRVDYHPEQEASKWIYKVLRHKLKILFYSGDTDGALPTYGTKMWIQSLEWPRTVETE